MSHRLRSLAGGMAIVAGALFVLSEIAMIGDMIANGDRPFAELVTTTLFQVNVTALLIAFALAIPAVMGIYRQQAEQSGTFGLVAAGLVCFALILATGVMWTELFTAPWLAENAPQLLGDDAPGGSLELGFMVSFMGLSAATVLFGVSVLMARVYPRWLAALTIVAGIVSALPFLPAGAGLLIGAAMVCYGVVLRHEVQGLEETEAARAMPPGAPA